MALLGSAVLGFIMSLTEYYVEKRKAMEEFWLQSNKTLKELRKIKYLELDAPVELIKDALLEEQANEKPSLNPSNKGANDSKENQVSEQISLFTETTESPILEKLRQLDIYNMTPMEVMLAVSEMKKHL